MVAVVLYRLLARLLTLNLTVKSVPRIYDALKVGTETTLEVQQQLGDGIVRTIAMGSTEGLNVVYQLATLAHQSLYLWVKVP